MSSHKDLVTDLQLEVVSLRRALNQAQAELAKTNTSAAKPPVEPDSEVARQLKGERTKNANLRSRLADMKRWYEQELLRNGKMPLNTARAILRRQREPYRSNLLRLRSGAAPPDTSECTCASGWIPATLFACPA